MATRAEAAEERQLVSPSRVKACLDEIFTIAKGRGLTMETIAADSGVALTTIYGWKYDDKEPSFSKALSIAVVVGERAVNKLIALIGYGGATPLDEINGARPMEIAARALAGLSVITTAAADGRIDHTETERCREAADVIIAEVLPLSSAGRAV